MSEVVVAFSNATGGSVLIGVSDAGDVRGRTSATGLTVEDAIHDVMTTVRDPGRYRIYELDVEGRPITVLAVEPRREGFAQTSDGRVLRRQGKRNVALYGAELADFVSRRLQRPFEATTSRLPLRSADRELVVQLSAAYAWPRDTATTKRLVEIGLTSREPEPSLTVAGTLLLVGDPEREIAKGYVEVRRYKDEGADYDRRVEVRGDVRSQIVQTTDHVLNELGTEMVVLGIRRHDLPRLPAVVVREAIANAVAHRSYEMAGTAILIELRPDAVVITSPGGLVEPVTVENMREQQAARNPALISVLRRFGLAEDAGRGVDVMEDAMAVELLDPPRFDEDGKSVTVTLPIRSAVSPRERAWVKELYDRGDIRARDRLLLVHAARGEILTNRRVRDLLNIDSTEARQALSHLTGLGHLRKEGRRGGTTYFLADDLAPPAGLSLNEAELLELIVDMAREQRVTNRSVRERTGLERDEVLRLFDQLVQQNRIARHGERRGTYYTAASR